MAKLGLLVFPLFLAFEILGQEAIQHLIASGEIRPERGDRVVLLQPKSGPKEFLPIPNFSDKDSPSGHCLGIHQIQLGLWSAVRFDPRLPKDDRKAKQALLRAAEPERKSQEREVIGGYSSLSEFFADMQKRWGPDNPLYQAIREAQQTLSVRLDSQSLARFAVSSKEKSHRGMKGTSVLSSSIIDPMILSASLRSKIDQSIPVSMGIYPREGQVGDKIQLGVGHALMVVGYVENPDENPPRRFLVVDPNDPQKLKIIKADVHQGWTYSFSEVPGGKPETKAVVAGVLDQSSQSLRERELKDRFSLDRISEARASCGASDFGAGLRDIYLKAAESR